MQKSLFGNILRVISDKNQNIDLIISNNPTLLKWKSNSVFHKTFYPAPIEEESDSSVIGGLMGLYAIAFLVTGSMFVFMGIPSFEYLSEKLAVGSGLICLIGSLIFYSKRRKKVN